MVAPAEAHILNWVYHNHGRSRELVARAPRGPYRIFTEGFGRNARIRGTDRESRRDRATSVLSSGDAKQAASTQTADGPFKPRRRSSRLTIDIPIEIISKGPQNKIRIEETRTFVVNAHGCGFNLKSALQPGESVVLIHKLSREEVTCRVVMCRKVAKTGDWEAGVEFRTPSPRFWHIAFPPDDWDPNAPPGSSQPQREGSANRPTRR